jgi:uncharacterized protein YciI
VYVLVLFRGAARAGEQSSYAAAHEKFITSLIWRSLVLLGGEFGMKAGEFDAAYLLRCRSMADARRIAAKDPFFAEQVYEPVFTEWKLVGVNPDLIDADLVVTSRDV